MARAATGRTAATEPTAAARTTNARTTTARTVFLLVPGACLLAGLDAALLLAGTWAPVTAAHLPGRHGMLMVLGFLGTLIALERAVALRAAWAYLAPASLGLGGLALAVGLPAPVGALFLAQGCALLLAVYGGLYRRRADATVAVEALGALAALVAALLWLRLDVATLLPWLITFIVATIAAERVELARLHLPARAESLALAAAAALICAATATLLAGDAAARAFGAVLLALVAWLVRHDVARRTIRSSGLPRFSAAAMLAGYVWLAVAATVLLARGRPADGATYDVVVHATFLGFAMSMVLAHAPVILPAIVRRPLPYRPALWAPLLVLHAGLVARVAGDLAGARDPWLAGSVATVAALLILPPVLVATASRASRAQPRRPAPPQKESAP